MKRHWDVPVLMVGCKDDLRSTEPLSSLLSESMASSFAESLELSYTECSALNGDSSSVFRLAGMLVMANERREHYKTPGQMYGRGVNLVRGIGEMSIARAMRHLFSVYSDRLALGERMYDATGRELLRYNWTTYKQLGERVRNFGVGLKKLVPSRSYVCLCAENSVSWMVADMAMQIQNVVSVMVHYTLPDEDIDYIVSHSELDAVITTRSLVQSFARAAATNPKLKAIIVQEDLDNNGRPLPLSSSSAIAKPINLILDDCREISPNTKFLLMEEVEKIGKDLLDAPERASTVVEYDENNKDDDVFTISYTSGSTGRPKGIMMSYKAHRADVIMETTGGSIGVVFEPLSHSERLNSYAKLCGGGRIVLFRGEVANLLEELQICGPTVFISVPRFWNVLYGEYNKVVALYRKHLPEKGPRAAHAVARNLFESLMGGRIIYAATGGAPIGAAVLTWMYGFSYIVNESYGSMEVGAITSSKKFSSELEFKIVDVPEMGYTSKDLPFPRGELCVKTVTMFSGYHNNDAETNEAFIEGGYFRTGDIVQLEGPDSVTIIDRKKFIFKLSQGEYVSPSKSEGCYSKSKFISQIMAYGNSLQSYLIALVVPNEAILTSWALSHNIQASFETLCSLPEIKALILTDMRNCELGSQLRPYEKVKDIFISSELMTPDNGLLTATSKLNRRGILNKYKSHLEALYSSPEALKEVNNDDKKTITPEETEALAQLKKLIASALPTTANADLDIQNGTHLASAGLDSLSALKLVKHIQQEMKVSIPIASLYQPNTTVESLAQAVSHQQTTVAHLRDDDNDVLLEEEINPSIDIDPYNWIPELLPKHQTPNDKRLAEKKKEESMKAVRSEAHKQLLERLHSPSPSAPTSESTGTIPSNEASRSSPKLARFKIERPKNTTSTGSHRFENLTYNNILLTGATGFLGVYLVKELLDSFPNATLHCIVRGASDEISKQKLVNALASAKIDQLDSELVPGTSKFERIKIINADLSNEKRFGLSEEKWNELCDTIDSIYHCATWVNTLFPYQVLRPANVVSTVQLVKLALTGQKNQRKPFHYISTLSTLSPHSGWSPEFSISSSAKLYGFDGYPLTKRVCEMLLGNIEDLIPDFPLVIYRPGAIVGHSKTGHFNIDAYVHKLICGVTQFGFYPVSKKRKMQFDWVPVDYCAKAIAHISKTGGAQRAPRRYNICNPYSLYSMNMTRLAKYINSFGYDLKPKNFRFWRRDLYAEMDKNPGKNVLEPLRSNFEDGIHSDPRMECPSTLASLRPLKLVSENSKNTTIDHDAEPIAICRPISEEAIHAMLRFAIEKGYIQPPTSSSSS